MRDPLPSNVTVEPTWYRLGTFYTHGSGEHVYSAVALAGEPTDAFGKTGFRILPGLDARWVVWEADYVPLATGVREQYGQKWVDVAREEVEREADTER